MGEKWAEDLDVVLWGNQRADSTVRIAGLGARGRDAACLNEHFQGTPAVYLNPDQGWTDFVTEESVT
jgi:hypothetical protein